MGEKLGLRRGKVGKAGKMRKICQGRDENCIRMTGKNRENATKTHQK